MMRTNRQLGERDVYAETPPVGSLIVVGKSVWRVVDATTGEVFVQDDRDPNTTGRIRVDGRREWRIVPEHYAVCSRCGEPMPCRHLRTEWQADAEIERAQRYMSIPEGACWACRSPISSRQKSVMFLGDNLKVPGGPPVRFHRNIRECRSEALRYQDEWVKAEAGREPFLKWYDPYTGNPTTVQARILGKASRGELYCYLQWIHQPPPGADLTQIMTDHDSPWSTSRWVPMKVDNREYDNIPPLLDAGLLAEPAAKPAAWEHGRVQAARYVLTDKGRETLRKVDE